MTGTGVPAGSRGKASVAKWQQILGAASRVFAAKGYEATTIRDVAEAVGMLGGSLYYYIQTKEDLLYQLLDTFHREGDAAIQQIEQELVDRGEDDPLTVLRAVCERHAQHNADHATLSLVFHNDFRHLGDERKQHIVQSRRRHQERIESLVRACQERGEIRPDQDPQLTAVVILSLLNSTSSWYRSERDRSGQAIGTFLADLLIDGLAIRPGTAEPKKATARRTTRNAAAPTGTKTSRSPRGATAAERTTNGRRRADASSD